jgi:hypothetical protein
LELFKGTNLSARWAVVSGVLGDFHLLDAVLLARYLPRARFHIRLSEGSTVSGSVLSGDTNLLCSLGLDD